MTTKTRRKANGSKQTDGEQVIVTAEFTALAFTIAAKNILREQHGWDEAAAEAFGATLWEQASGRMATAINSAGKRPEQRVES